jgi:hypothetical protein
MITKMFATMSDRSSVNKKFTEELNKYKRDISESDSDGTGNSSDLIYLYCNAHLSHKCEPARGHACHAPLDLQHTHDANMRLVTSVLDEAAQVVRKAHKELDPSIDENGIIDITVSYDGTWMTRGFKSMYGAGCVVDVIT